MDEMMGDDDTDAGALKGAINKKNQAVRDVATTGMQGLPTSPISGEVARTLVGTMNDAIDTFGAGQLDELKIAEPADDLMEIPPDLATGLVALSKLFSASKSGSKYVFEPIDVTDDAGAQTVLAKIANATSDSKLVRELTAPTTAFTPSSGSSNTQLGKADPPPKKKRDASAYAFTGDTTNDNRKV